MKKNKFKLTPEAHTKIKLLAKEFPKLQKLSKNGEPLFRLLTITKKGSELPPDTKLNSGESINKDKVYVTRVKEPILVNHELNMIDVYKKDGEAGIIDYVKYIDLMKSKTKTE